MAISSDPPQPCTLAACHCFRERSYDRRNPAAADAYFLASARNSLLSAAFGIPKREIVQAEMGGAAPDDLWVAHWAGARSRLAAPGLLHTKQEQGSWRQALGPDAARVGAPFEALLQRGASDAALAALAVDDVLVARAGVDAATVSALRQAGASSSETVLAVVAGARGGRPAPELLAAVRAGKRSWGAVLDAAGVKGADLDGIVRAMVR